MFEQSLVLDNGVTNKGWTFMVSLTGQFAMVGLAILAPLIVTDAIRPVQLAQILVAPSPPPPPPPAPPVESGPRMTRIPVRQFLDGIMRAPSTIPKQIAMLIEEELPPASASGGVQGGVQGGVPGGILNGVIGSVLQHSAAAAAPPPPPPVAAKTVEMPKVPTRITVGGLVQQAKAISQPIPVFPPLARQARIQGTVKLEGIIATDGRIKELKVISGHPMLIPAALEAVRRWLYRPTTLNGEPVEVVAPIDVNFILQ